jgi:GNAT superfamily N-acetyltransferase
MVEPLTMAQRPEIQGILAPAFATHPAFAPGTPLSTVAALLDLFLDMFFVPGRSFLYGLRREGRLACACLTLDPRAEPEGWKRIVVFYRFMRIMGCRTVLDFIRAYQGRPRYAEPYLELFLLGTDPARQRQGLGREMLRFLYGRAGEQGYRGLILTAARHSPACGFYAREGFVMDNEVRFRGEPMVNMRRESS